MPALAPVPPLPKVTVPLNSLIPPLYRHYFNRYPDRPNYLVRRYDFPGDLGFLPLVRAFLDTCAAAQSADYRYLFTLLGSELAGNAIEHTRSGGPGGTYSLLVRRHTDALTLTCQDEGTVAAFVPAPRPAPLSAPPLNYNADPGRNIPVDLDVMHPKMRARTCTEPRSAAQRDVLCAIVSGFTVVVAAMGRSERSE